MYIFTRSIPSCLSPDNNNVQWWYIKKLPLTNAYLYMDEHNVIFLSDITLAESALGRTLESIKTNEVLMFNDKPWQFGDKNENQETPLNGQWQPDQYGTSKGFVALTSSGNGIHVKHTMPGFPAILPTNNEVAMPSSYPGKWFPQDYHLADEQSINLNIGHSFLCHTLIGLSNLEMTAFFNTLVPLVPKIYFNTFSERNLRFLNNIFEGSIVDSSAKQYISPTIEIHSGLQSSAWQSFFGYTTVPRDAVATASFSSLVENRLPIDFSNQYNIPLESRHWISDVEAPGFAFDKLRICLGDYHPTLSSSPASFVCVVTSSAANTFLINTAYKLRSSICSSLDCETKLQSDFNGKGQVRFQVNTVSTNIGSLLSRTPFDSSLPDTELTVVPASDPSCQSDCGIFEYQTNEFASVDIVKYYTPEIRLYLKDNKRGISIQYYSEDSEYIVYSTILKYQDNLFSPETVSTYDTNVLMFYRTLQMLVDLYPIVNTDSTFTQPQITVKINNQHTAIINDNNNYGIQIDNLCIDDLFLSYSYHYITSLNNNYKLDSLNINDRIQQQESDEYAEQLATSKALIYSFALKFKQDIFPYLRSDIKQIIHCDSPVSLEIYQKNGVVQPVARSSGLIASFLWDIIDNQADQDEIFYQDSFTSGLDSLSFPLIKEIIKENVPSDIFTVIDVLKSKIQSSVIDTTMIFDNLDRVMNLNYIYKCNFCLDSPTNPPTDPIYEILGRYQVCESNFQTLSLSKLYETVGKWVQFDEHQISSNVIWDSIYESPLIRYLRSSQYLKNQIGIRDRYYCNNPMHQGDPFSSITPLGLDIITELIGVLTQTETVITYGDHLSTYFIPLENEPEEGFGIVMFDGKICSFTHSTKVEFESGELLQSCPVDPFILSVGPLTGDTKDETTLIIKGRNLQYLLVKFGDIYLEDCDYTNEDDLHQKQCTIPSGLGTKSISITTPKEPSLRLPNTFQFQYNAPTISSPRPSEQFNTVGSEITLYGSNLFSMTSTVNDIKLKIGGVSIALISGGIQDSKEYITFKTRGSGWNKNISIEVGGQIYEQLDFIDHKAPNIDSISKVMWKTDGEEDIIITGSQFGDESLTIDESPISSLTCNSLIRVSDNKITCKSVIGGGKNLKFSIHVDSQQSNFLPFDYIAPTILQVVQEPFVNTSYGGNFWVVGLNLATMTEFVPSVNMSNDHYQLYECIVDEESVCFPNKLYSNEDGQVIEVPTQQTPDKDFDPYIEIDKEFRSMEFDCIKCRLPAGVGNDNIVILEVLQQLSGNSTDSLVFPRPLISKVINNTSGTDGSVTLSIFGTNFSPKEQKFVYDEESEDYYEVPLIEYERGFDRSNISIGHYHFKNITWVNSSLVHTEIYAGVGANLTISLFLGNQSMLNIEPNQILFNFSYERPNISAIVGNLNTSANNEITINGFNFIPKNQTFLKQSDFDTSYLTIGENNCTTPTWTNSTSFTCTLHPGIGANLTLTVFIGNQSNIDGVKNFSYSEPHIKSVDSSDTKGGSVITIHGVNFVPKDVDPKDSKVLIDDVECKNINWIDQDRIECTPPPGIGKNISLEVGIANQNTTENIFKYNEPSIEEIPNVLTHGELITIKGTNFVPKDVDPKGSNLTINDELCDDITFIDETQISCKFLKGIGKDQPLSISIDSQSVKAKFNYKIPEITEIPNSDTSGSTITIKGDNFVPKDVQDGGPTSSYVEVNGKKCTDYDWIDHNQLSCKIPIGIGKNVPFKLYIGKQTHSNNQHIDYNPPSLPSDSDYSGPTNGDLTLMITGSNFVPSDLASSTPTNDQNNYVKIGGKSCQSLTWKDSNSLQCKIPIGTGVKKSIEIKVGGQLNQQNTYFSYDKPTIREITPEKGRMARNTIVTIKGTNFGNVQDKVSIDGKDCNVFTWNHEQIVCVAPQSSSEGEKTVSVTVDSQQSNQNIKYTYYDKPKIERIEPKEGSIDGDEQLTIYGSNLIEDGSTLKVYFKKQECPVVSSTKDQIVFTNKKGAGQNIEIYIKLVNSKLSDQISNTNTEFSFTGPSISKINPESGDKNTKQPIEITGTNLGLVGDEPSVMIGSKECSNVKVISSSKVTCIVPTSSTAKVEPVKLTFYSKEATSSYEYTEEESSSESESSSSDSVSDSTEEPEPEPEEIITQMFYIIGVPPIVWPVPPGPPPIIPVPVMVVNVLKGSTAFEIFRKTMILKTPDNFEFPFSDFDSIKIDWGKITSSSLTKSKFKIKIRFKISFKLKSGKSWSCESDSSDEDDNDSDGWTRPTVEGGPPQGKFPQWLLPAGSDPNQIPTELPNPPALLLKSKIKGRLFEDKNQNMKFDGDDTPITNNQTFMIGIVNDDGDYTNGKVNSDGTYEVETDKQLGLYTLVVTSIPIFSNANYFLPQTRFHIPFTFEGYEQNIPVFTKSPLGCLGTVETYSKKITLQYGEYNLLDFGVYMFETSTPKFPDYCQVNLFANKIAIKYKTTSDLTLFLDTNLDGSPDSSISSVDYDVLSTVDGKQLIRSYSYKDKKSFDLPSSSYIRFKESTEMTPIINNYYVKVEDPNKISTISSKLGFINIAPSKTISFTGSNSQILSLTFGKFTKQFFTNIEWTDTTLSFTPKTNQTVIFSKDDEDTNGRIASPNGNQYVLNKITFGNVEIVNQYLFSNVIPSTGDKIVISNDYPFKTASYFIDSVQIKCDVLDSLHYKCDIPASTGGVNTKQITSKWNDMNLYNIHTLTYSQSQTTTTSSTTSSTGTSSTTGGVTTTGEITTSSSTTGGITTTGEITTTSTTSTTGGGGSFSSYIYGYIHDDRNYNNQYDQGEPFLTNFKIQVIGNNNFDYRTTSNESGIFEFRVVEPGTYKITIDSDIDEIPYFIPIQTVYVRVSNQLTIVSNITVFSKSNYECFGTISNAERETLSIQYGSFDLSNFNYNFNSYYQTYSFPPICNVILEDSIITVKYKSMLNLSVFYDENFNGLNDDNATYPVNISVLVQSNLKGKQLERSFIIDKAPYFIVTDIPGDSFINMTQRTDSWNTTIGFNTKNYSIPDATLFSTIDDSLILFTSNPNNTISLFNDRTISNNTLIIPFGKYNSTFFDNLSWNTSNLTLTTMPDQIVVITLNNGSSIVIENNQTANFINFNITTIELIYLDLFKELPLIPLVGGSIKLFNVYWNYSIQPELSIEGFKMNCLISSIDSSFVDCSVPPYLIGDLKKAIKVTWNGMDLYQNGFITYETPLTTTSTTSTSTTGIPTTTGGSDTTTTGGSGSTTTTSTTGDSTTAGSTTAGSTTGGTTQTTLLVGYLFNDTNFDGIFDSSEKPMRNIKVEIVGPVNSSTTTSSTGQFSFINLIPGSYEIKVDFNESSKFYNPIGNYTMQVTNQFMIQRNIALFWKSPLGCVGSATTSDWTYLVQYGSHNLTIFKLNTTNINSTAFVLPDYCVGTVVNNETIEIKYKTSINLTLYYDININGTLDESDLKVNNTVNSTIMITSIVNNQTIIRNMTSLMIPSTLLIDLPSNSTFTIISDPQSKTSAILNNHQISLSNFTTLHTVNQSFAFYNEYQNNTLTLGNNETISTFTIPYGKYNVSYLATLGFNSSSIKFRTNVNQSVLLNYETETLNISNSTIQVFNTSGLDSIELYDPNLFNISFIPSHGSSINLTNRYWNLNQANISIEGVNIDCHKLNDTDQFVSCSIPRYIVGNWTRSVSISMNNHTLYPNYTITYQNNCSNCTLEQKLLSQWTVDNVNYYQYEANITNYGSHDLSFMEISIGNDESISNMWGATKLQQYLYSLNIEGVFKSNTSDNLVYITNSSKPLDLFIVYCTEFISTPIPTTPITPEQSSNKVRTSSFRSMSNNNNDNNCNFEITQTIMSNWTTGDQHYTLYYMVMKNIDNTTTNKHQHVEITIDTNIESIYGIKEQTTTNNYSIDIDTDNKQLQKEFVIITTNTDIDPIISINQCS
ncbi:hypothetical protein PPL_10707 [Heterostelium album PN500]|uniref:IPT/TIG domain-containing protein n=1 Tax=Heterostelium pallidum (strain ATCC 26659 / Pp 5 / PN500) TaxID=670386 RepID=D3BRU5_HETP5|nr:hypothetical protein PPL_10707 [Heterostelium album PN500]EFA76127.1 hypothetical protein PPL_10707 [Heterostelium album PN500]|eukprot:XP_020428261.1 hypothetical protein PPL_10707 [Heterostelium album PN500]